MAETKSSGWQSIYELLRPHRTALAIGFAAAVGDGITNLLEPWPIKLVLDNVAKNKAPDGWLNRLVFSFASEDRTRILMIAAAAALVIAVIGAICSYFEKYFITSVGQWILHDLRNRLYARMHRLSLSYHDQAQTGDLVSRVTGDIDSVQSFVTSGILDALINSLTLVGMVGVMLYLDWRFTLIALSIAPVLFLVIFRYTRQIKKSSREVRKKEGEIVSVISEVLGAMRVVKAFAREEYEQKRLEEESLESVELALHARGLKARLAPLVDIIVAVGTALVLWFGAKMVLDGTLSSGSLVVFILYLKKMYKPMQDLSKMTDSYSKASVAYERIREVLDTDADVADPPGARKAPAFKGAIEFDHVTFGYEPDRPVLKDISFKIEPGQVVALVGPSGAGKSTVVSLIPRFYDPSEGKILIDGQDVRRYTLRSVRDQISFVLQSSMLFHAPIWKNIAYGKPNASRDEILKAAEAANANEFIEKLPEGYDTMVGERGVTLSGGQAQRIAIARAVIRNTPILLLDEPSSGLDSGSEKLVFDALDRLMKDKTSIVIAHRLSTIRDAQLILVVKDGQLVEQGTHDELMHRAGVYAEMHELQFNTIDN